MLLFSAIVRRPVNAHFAISLCRGNRAHDAGDDTFAAKYNDPNHL
jgi:hypothetical protein